MNNNNNTHISNAIIRRLPRYRRYLNELRSKGITKISSSEFSALLGYTASQIRQDLNTFGGFGQQGYGYNVDKLFDEISAILGLDREYRTVVIGFGNLGKAIANYTYYYKVGFNIVGIFDIDENIIGTTTNDIPIKDFKELEQFTKDNSIDIGIICVNRESAQEVADVLVCSGIKGIWNFAPIDINIPDEVAIENVHLSESLQSLAFLIKNNEK